MHSFYATASGGELIPSNKRELADYLSKHEGKTFFVQMKRERGVRTDNQNRSLHLYCSHVAQELNDAGYSIQLALKESQEIDWDMARVKELIWRPTQIALTKKDSTTKLDKVEDIGIIYEHLNRFLGEKFGIHVPWPSSETKDEAPLI